jgi:hypothetical protein
MSFSDYLENKLLNHIFSRGSYQAPVICVGLALNPTEESTGADCGEVSFGGYHRILTSAGDWAVSLFGRVVNAVTLTFPKATENWGDVTDFILVDALTPNTGNLLGYGKLQVNRNGVPTEKTWFIEEDSTPFFVPGDVEIFLD